MPDLQERIKKLEVKLEKLGISLKKITEKVQGITDKNLLEELKLKERELEDYRSQLLTYQTEKEQISKELSLEVAKVISSNLSNEDKSQQIITLTTNNQQQFAETSQHLHSAWQNYNQIQQKIIEVLENKNQDEFKKAIAKSDQTNQRNFTIKITLLVIIIFFLLIPYLKKIKSWLKKLGKSK
jgi:hypothetical protein